MTKKEKDLFTGHAIGTVTTISAFNILMDYAGLDKTVDYMRAHWVTMPWWPWAVLFMAMIVLLHYLGRKP